MAIQTEPTRIQIPFADSGTKNVIPDTNSTPSASQAASWTDGFPAQCSLPLSAGGIPPARADFNGLLNTMTQSERFTQEGGVWAWDATVDYAANRVVLGSDGLLYWSIAQSGPNVGGAQDPTTDASHTYWSTMPMLTPGLGDRSNKTATTDWVRTLAVAPIYLDPAGSDSNDGMSASSAVKTFGRAVTIAQTLPQSTAKFVVAGGTYSETARVLFSSIYFEIQIQGNVTISKNIAAINGATLLISDNSAGYKLTVTETSNPLGAVVYISNNSEIIVDCDIEISGSTLAYGLRVQFGSTFYASGNVSISVSNVANHAASLDSANLVVVGNSLTISGSSVAQGFSASGCSVFLRSNLDMSALSCTYGIVLSRNASFACADLEDGTAPTVKVASTGSAIRISSSFMSLTNATASVSSGGELISVRNGATVNLEYCTVSLTLNNAASAIVVSLNSHCNISNSAISFNGVQSYGTLNCSNASAVGFSSTTLSGTVTGPRYSISTNSVVNTGGLGANYIPGSSAGTTSTQGLYL